MRKTKHFTLAATLLVLATGVVYAGTAGAQPQPPMPPGMAFMPGDLHVRIVDTPRPAVRHEVRTERPDPNHVWVGGFWHHTGQEWSWNDGRWYAPPRHHAHWVAPKYKKVKGGTQYIPGHWSHEKVIYN